MNDGAWWTDNTGQELFDLWNNNGEMEMSSGAIEQINFDDVHPEDGLTEAEFDDQDSADINVSDPQTAVEKTTNGQDADTARAVVTDAALHLFLLRLPVLRDFEAGGRNGSCVARGQAVNPFEERTRVVDPLELGHQEVGNSTLTDFIRHLREYENCSRVRGKQKAFTR